MPDDALIASKMNLSDGGKNQGIRRATSFLKDGIAREQVMMHADGTVKGLRTVLTERGLWKSGLKRACHRNEDSRPFLESEPCCAECLLANQPDFKSQKSMLVEEIERRGHKAVFYPKYHCELNFIEYFWGAAKRYARDNCLYTFKGLRQIVPVALASVKCESIRKFAAMSLVYMDGYRKGLTGADLDKAARKYKSHRRVAQLFAEYENSPDEPQFQ